MDTASYVELRDIPKEYYDKYNYIGDKTNNLQYDSLSKEGMFGIMLDKEPRPNSIFYLKDTIIHDNLIDASGFYIRGSYGYLREGYYCIRNHFPNVMHRDGVLVKMYDTAFPNPINTNIIERKYITKTFGFELLDSSKLNMVSYLGYSYLVDIEKPVSERILKQPVLIELKDANDNMKEFYKFKGTPEIKDISDNYDLDYSIIGCDLSCYNGNSPESYDILYMSGEIETKNGVVTVPDGYYMIQNVSEDNSKYIKDGYCCIMNSSNEGYLYKTMRYLGSSYLVVKK